MKTITTTTKTTTTATSDPNGRTRKMTMKAIATTLAALSMMSTISIAVSADEISTAIPEPAPTETTVGILPLDPPAEVKNNDETAMEILPTGEQYIVPPVKIDDHVGKIAIEDIQNGLTAEGTETVDPTAEVKGAEGGEKEILPTGEQDVVPPVKIDDHVGKIAIEDIQNGLTAEGTETVEPAAEVKGTEGGEKEILPTGEQYIVPPVPADEAAAVVQDNKGTGLTDEERDFLRKLIIDKEAGLPDSVPAEANEGIEPVLSSAQDTANEKKSFTPGKDIFVHPEKIENDSDLTEEEKKILRTIVISVTKAGIDAFGDGVPGGKFISEPLKALFEDATGGEDPTKAAIDKLSADQAKYYDDLRNRINTLNSSLNTYTKYLENTVENQGERQSIGQMFRNMSTNLNDFSSKVNAIVESDQYSPEQKLVLIADLNNNSDGGVNYCANTRQWAYQISTTIGNKNQTAVDMDLYKTLTDLAAQNYMFKGEAYNEALVSAQALTEQYMYANMLLLQCQNATIAVKDLDPAVLGDDPEIIEAYRRCIKDTNQRFQMDKQQESIDRIIGCMAGFEEFNSQKKEGNRYIKKGTMEEETVLDFTIRTVNVPNSDEFRNMCKNQYFSKQEMDEFIEYVRASDMSINEFLYKNDQSVTQVISNIGSSGTNTKGKHTYLVVDANLTGSCKKNARGDFWNGYIDEYTQTIKVIDIYDPECKVQELKVTTYDINYQHGDIHGTVKNIKSYGNDFIFIGAHTATEKDNINYYTTENGLTIKGPRVNGPTIDTLHGPKISVPKSGSSKK